MVSLILRWEAEWLLSWNRQRIAVGLFSSVNLVLETLYNNILSLPPSAGAISENAKIKNSEREFMMKK